MIATDNKIVERCFLMNLDRRGDRLRDRMKQLPIRGRFLNPNVSPPSTVVTSQRETLREGQARFSVFSMHEITAATTRSRRNLRHDAAILDDRVRSEPIGEPR
ncbi:hypothetical protein Pla22_41630 [Rubripirellula amarantea]|uniref:Uncharacterized protein n=1 Tax=Rubripirellula amarantea TaxID=2527999 RepID=A0A5C5WMH6_9BACT|nr:hypothetical protein [Rubripirellula amarantea]TWT51385.1 hypothetical protein Pla22_41630 [Rubripirellula amarantea]